MGSSNYLKVVFENGKPMVTMPYVMSLEHLLGKMQYGIAHNLIHNRDHNRTEPGGSPLAMRFLAAVAEKLPNGLALPRCDAMTASVLDKYGDPRCQTVHETAAGNAPPGTECAFPFTYDGATYNECAYGGRSIHKWCFTAVMDHGEATWGECHCTPNSVETSKGMPLVAAYGRYSKASRNFDHMLMAIGAGATISDAAASAAYGEEVSDGCEHMWVRLEDRRRLHEHEFDYVHMTHAGTAPEGTACEFPFTYGGVEYNKCADNGKQGIPWCKTAVANPVGTSCDFINPSSRLIGFGDGSCVSTGTPTYVTVTSEDACQAACATNDACQAYEYSKADSSYCAVYSSLVSESTLQGDNRCRVKDECSSVTWGNCKCEGSSSGDANSKYSRQKHWQHQFTQAISTMLLMPPLHPDFSIHSEYGDRSQYYSWLRMKDSSENPVSDLLGQASPVSGSPRAQLLRVIYAQK